MRNFLRFAGVIALTPIYWLFGISVDRLIETIVTWVKERIVVPVFTCSTIGLVIHDVEMTINVHENILSIEGLEEQIYNPESASDEGQKQIH